MIRDFSTLVNESSCWKPIRSWTAENKSRRCHLLKEKGQPSYIAAAAAAASTSNRITGKTYALSFQLRSLFKACTKAVFREPALGDIIIFPFIGEENPKLAAKWISSFVKWAISEKLNAEQQHWCASAALFGSASDWCMKMHLERATWEEFYFLFREKYVNKILEWPGILLLQNDLDLPILKFRKPKDLKYIKVGSKRPIPWRNGVQWPLMIQLEESLETT